MSVPHEFKAHSGQFDSCQLEQLACPACLGALQLISPVDRIVCMECGRAYPLIDGIPVLIADRAMPQKPE